MTCRKCKHEFCWMCMGLWSEHGTSWYNCNRYEEKSGIDARDTQARSRASLERYLHVCIDFLDKQDMCAKYIYIYICWRASKIKVANLTLAATSTIIAMPTMNS